MVVNPLFASGFLTILLSLYFIVDGVSEIAVGRRNQARVVHLRGRHLDPARRPALDAVPALRRLGARNPAGHQAAVHRPDHDHGRFRRPLDGRRLVHFSRCVLVDGRSGRTMANDKFERSGRNAFGPHAHDAAVPAHQGRASGLSPLLSHGRFLRAVLRRRPPRRQAHRHHADLARPVRGRTDSDGRRAVSQRRHLSFAAGAQGRVGGDLRADRRPGEIARVRSIARWCAWSRPARSPTTRCSSSAAKPCWPRCRGARERRRGLRARLARSRRRSLLGARGRRRRRARSRTRAAEARGVAGSGGSGARDRRDHAR